MSITSFILATSNDKSSTKDDIKKENDLLWTELDSLHREYKKLKKLIEQLTVDYEESKDFDPVRRYGKLKVMIKRAVLHIRLNQDEQGHGSSGGISGLPVCKDYSHQVEAVKRREERQSNMSKQDFVQANNKLREQIRDMRRQCSVIRDVIKQLDRNYQTSKRFSSMQRYRMMKNMVKQVIHDKLIN